LEAGVRLADSQIDKLVFTGGFRNGTHVLENLSRRAVPAIVELSGSDPVIVCVDADVRLVAKALHFGMTLNHGRTCMAPRRVFVPVELLPAVEAAVREIFSSSDLGTYSGAGAGEAVRLSPLLRDALERGATLLCGDVSDSGIKFPCVLSDVSENMEVLSADLFASVAFLIPVESEEAAVAGASRGGFALGASVFSNDQKRAERVSMRLKAGLVSVNDLIVPSADPRVPFGGSGKSGYGVTRGGEGLLSMTRGKVLQVRSGGMTRHLESGDLDLGLAGALARVLHAGGVRAKLSAFMKLCRMARRHPTKVKKSAISEDSI
jgi:acyl-CoA reductase-like NAD-dependent aldehyde dehydrogenase